MSPRSELDFRVEEVTRRPVQVQHSFEEKFDIRLPDAVEEKGQGVTLLKPGRTGL